MAYASWYANDYTQGLTYLKAAYANKERIPWKYQLWLEMWHASLLGNKMEDVVKYCDLLAESGINTRLLWFDLGVTYHDFPKDYVKAVAAFDKVMEINKEKGSDWKFEFFYDRFGDALHKLGKHEQEKELYDIGLRVLPENMYIIHNRITCFLSQGDTVKANKLISTELAMWKKLGWPESQIEQELGIIYAEANLISQSEFHIRKAFQMDPKNQTSIFYLAYFLIDYNVNVDEGLELVNKSLEIKPNSRILILLKGIGKYKQGKYEEAVQLLNSEFGKSIQTYTQLYHYLPEAKLALAKQKNN
jgi:tetratricopeptide (TPR) repeat protein